MSKGKLLLLLGALCSVTVQAMRVGNKTRAPLAANIMNAAKDRALAALNDGTQSLAQKISAVSTAVSAIAAAGNSAIAADVQNRAIAQRALDGYVADYIRDFDFSTMTAAVQGDLQSLASQIQDKGIEGRVLTFINSHLLLGTHTPPPPPGSGSKGGTPPPPTTTIQSLFNAMLALTDVDYRTDGDTQDWIQECDTSLVGLASSGDADQEAMITAVYNFYDQAKLLSVGAKLPLAYLDACVVLKDASAKSGSDKKRYTTWFDDTFQKWAISLVQAPPPPPAAKKPVGGTSAGTGAVSDADQLDEIRRVVNEDGGKWNKANMKKSFHGFYSATLGGTSAKNADNWDIPAGCSAQMTSFINNLTAGKALDKVRKDAIIDLLK